MGQKLFGLSTGRIHNKEKDSPFGLRAVFFSQEDAHEALNKNLEWLEEHYYNYAVIEEFESDRIDNVGGTRCAWWYGIIHHEDDTISIQAIETPNQFKNIISIGVP